VLYFIHTGGKHPFGDSYERDVAILRSAPNMAPLSAAPEAANLITAMLAKEPGARPTMAGVAGHPAWWSAEQRLQFLVDISDRWAHDACVCISSHSDVILYALPAQAIHG
jgi:serine/threonine-protein kinase/endoribonuclease IRE1